MLRNFIKFISGILAIAFLSISIFASFSKNTVLENYMNTDGLALWGCVLGLLTLLGEKFEIIRKLLNWIIVKLNFIELDYQLEIKFCLNEAKDILSTSVKELKNSISSSQNYKIDELKLLKSSNRQKIFEFKPMASNISIRSYPNNNISITFRGVCKYERFNKNIRFIADNLLEDFNNKNLNIERINLQIFKNNTEGLIVDKGFFSHFKKYTISNSNLEIVTKNNSIITINGKVGVTLNSKSKKTFMNSLEDLEYFLIK